MKAEKENTNLEASDVDTESTKSNGQETMEVCEERVCRVETAKVEKVIRDSVYASMGIGIVPIALFNVAAVTASNLNLVKKLSNLYSVEFKEDAAKKIIASITGAGVSSLASPLVGSALIGIPLIGLPLAIGTAPILNGMTTYALGKMFLTHFERGGTLIGANLDVLKEDFSSAYKNSREWLGNAIIGKKDVEPANA